MLQTVVVLLKALLIPQSVILMGNVLVKKISKATNVLTAQMDSMDYQIAQQVEKFILLVTLPEPIWHLLPLLKLLKAII